MVRRRRTGNHRHRSASTVAALNHWRTVDRRRSVAVVTVGPDASYGIRNEWVVPASRFVEIDRDTGLASAHDS